MTRIWLGSGNSRRSTNAGRDMVVAWWLHGGCMVVFASAKCQVHQGDKLRQARQRQEASFEGFCPVCGLISKMTLFCMDSLHGSLVYVVKVDRLLQNIQTKWHRSLISTRRGKVKKSHFPTPTKVYCRCNLSQI